MESSFAFSRVQAPAACRMVRLHNEPDRRTDLGSLCSPYTRRAKARKGARSVLMASRCEIETGGWHLFGATGDPSCDEGCLASRWLPKWRRIPFGRNLSGSQTGNRALRLQHFVEEKEVGEHCAQV